MWEKKVRCNDLWVAKSTDSLTFIYLFRITQVKCEVSIEELVAISINNIPGSYIPKMSKTTLKNNHKKKRGIQLFLLIKFPESYNSKMKHSKLS